ncbi:MAG: hypothetical protein IJO71_12970 [Microbacterium sp.]|jgi:hypothetical protein|uniref:hypothetical protein n=1 Tax=Microbacterium sp. TaxID=51671 RepID=UPI0025F7C401|nr:hypothetical protein [Microbacterium sp.]MBQ9918093.1 hypothetical protein [Microbacterium sp.]
MTTENIPSAGTGLSRRAVIKTAAWATPVIAVAVAAPLASASPGTARTNAFVGSNISANQSAGTASGSLTGSGGSITNVSGSWDSGKFTGVYRLRGPWSTATLTKPDGSSFVLGETISYSGTAWVVTGLNISDDDAEWFVEFEAPSITVTSDTTVLLPGAIYSGTFVPGTTGPGRPTKSNPIQAAVAFGAEHVNSGALVGSSSNFPAG